jgi:hypothetical protein
MIPNLVFVVTYSKPYRWARPPSTTPSSILCNSQPQAFAAESRGEQQFSRDRNSTETFGVASSRERRKNVETGDRLEHDEGWENVKKLIELAKSAHARPLSPARRQRIRDELLRRLEQDRIEQAERQRMRRRVAGAFVAGASTMLVAGLILKLVSGGGLPWAGPSSGELARHQAALHSVVE